MKRYLQICLACFVIGSIMYTDALANGEILRRSHNASYPQPFAANGNNPKSNAAISTGYYIVDGSDNASDAWRPNYAKLFQTLDFEPATWKRIVSGPNQFPDEYWEHNPEGKPYFRNPNNPNDSTDNAIAGPISIGFPFYFNGVRYDSFYVSTNGLIGFSNRRYFYDAAGNRTIPDGETTAYDPNSDDMRDRNDPTGLNDPTPDNYGYRFIALGNTNSPTGGLRSYSNSNGLERFMDDGSSRAPVLAPLWDDYQLSQFNEAINQPEDYGQIHYKRSLNNNELRIYFVRMQPIGNKVTQNGTVTFPPNHRIQTSLSMEVSMQVVLNRRDSSIVFLYQSFQPPLLIINNRPVPPRDIVRRNATIGVRGEARYINPETANRERYLQYTEYLRDNTVFVQGPAGSELTTPQNNEAIKFKQWKNVLRVVDIRYLARDPNTGKFSKEIKNPNNYELLVGDIHLGAIQPVARIQNLTNDLQGVGGVNFQRQDLSFRARFRIQNDITERFVYNRQVCVDSNAIHNHLATGIRLVDWEGNPIDFEGTNGVPPYGLVEIKFPPYETNQFIDNQIGRLTSYIIAEPFECYGRGNYGDRWPFDDTSSVKLFGIRVLKNFSEDCGDFSFSRRDGTLPSVTKWVSLGAEVVDGDANTYNPPPPRGEFYSANDSNIILNSPVIRMNRIDINGNDLSRGGDKLISFPIDLRGHKRAVLSLSYQRTGRPPGGSFGRDWSFQTLHGPEPRVIDRGDTSRSVAIEDRLEVHFANPSENNYTNITNIPDNGYSKHPRLDDPGKFFSDNPAWTIFGAGGFRRGFHEANPDSALSAAEGLRSRRYDDGKDWEFNKIFIPIPDYILNAPNEGARYFRFKLETDALRNTNPPQPQDDDDNFYVDNIRIMFQTEAPDLEISLVRAHWPYTLTPASQAQEIPIIVKVANNSDFATGSFGIHTYIKRKGAPDSLVVYCHTKTIPFLPATTEVELNFQNWNARKTSPGTYVITSYIIANHDDPIQENFLTYSEFELRFGDSFAYDPASPESGQNDVPQYANKTGKGLNLEGYSSGSGDLPYPYGADAGNSSGQIAMKFKVSSQDTLYGFKAFFGRLNSDILNISFAVYEDAGSYPGRRINRQTILKLRGMDDILPDGPHFDQYTTYLLNQPIILTQGTYWVSVAQRGTEGFELGASASRMGMVTTAYHDQPVLGVSGSSLLIDKNLRERNIAGELINSNVIAFENTIGSGTWIPFTPTVGNPAYPFLAHSGSVSGFSTYSRGSWIPLIRPYFGHRAYADPPRYVECIFYPVELTGFDGEVLPPEGIELFWETASESNNAGFYVERKPAETGDDFVSIAFVKGAGNSTQMRRYVHLDTEVQPGTAYEYRLRQVDFDGTASYSKSIVLRYEFGSDALYISHYPNPIHESAEFNLQVHQTGPVRLDIVDILGNTVATLLDQEVRAHQEIAVQWNGRDANGEKLASGVYYARLSSGDAVVHRALNVIR